MKFMIVKILSAVLLLPFAVVAQSNLTPDGAVRALYTAHNAKRSPFFQTRSRTRVDQFFTKELADLIWKDAIESAGEVGALGADPLYDAQDTRITRFKVGKPSYGDGNLNVADVEVSFRNFGEEQRLLFRVERDRSRRWKVANIYYTSSGHGSIKEMLTMPASDDAVFDGRLNVGKASSYILYFGKESGDYAAYCFDNTSEAGKAILAKCKHGDRCVVRGETAAESTCRPDGFEADLSDSGRIVKVTSAVSRGKYK